MKGSMPGGRRKVTAMFCVILLAIACAGLLMMTACRRTPAGESLGVSVQQSIAPQPVRVGPATVSISLADASFHPIKGATIKVEADMSHPGMSPVFADAKEQQPGSYTANLNLDMGGDWVVLTHIALPGGKKIERQLDVRGVRSN